MRYVSTNGKSGAVDAHTAFVGRYAADGGLYMPEVLPFLPQAFFNNIGDMTMREIAFVVGSSFLSSDVRASDIKQIVDESFSFDAPLVKLNDEEYVLELFHGPTLTFKDYGARFAARTLAHLDSKSRVRERTVLVATTGNSGSSTANGLYGLPGINVVVPFPKGALTRIQVAQFASLGGNVHAIEVEGTIEDCKNLIQETMTDAQLSYLNLTTINSINIARIIPQIVFSLYAYAQLRAQECREADKAVYGIPCGNYSNLVATMLAADMGLPLGKIVGACNVNDTLGRLQRGEEFAKGPISTPAASLDIAMPSGASRVEYLKRGRGWSKTVVAPPTGDEEIAKTILELREKYGYTIGPNGAVAYAGTKATGIEGPHVIFATGHPAKSLDIMTRITGSPIELPVQLNRFMNGKINVRHIPPTGAALRRLLITL